MRFDTFVVDEMGLPDQEINLDDYLDNNKDNNHNIQVKNLKFESKQNNFYNNNANDHSTRVKNSKFEFKHNVFIAILIITWLSLIICCCTKLRPKEGYSNIFMYILSQFSKHTTVK